MAGRLGDLEQEARGVRPGEGGGVARGGGAVSSAAFARRSPDAGGAVSSGEHWGSDASLHSDASFQRAAGTDRAASRLEELERELNERDRGARVPGSRDGSYPARENRGSDPTAGGSSPPALGGPRPLSLSGLLSGPAPPSREGFLAASEVASARATERAMAQARTLHRAR